MFAKLTGKYQTISDGGFLLSQGWRECSWADTTRGATKLSIDEAERLISQLNERQPGSVYVAERDENGEANVPPYGLDNFVVRRS